jgi:hypothetical protein
MARDDPGQPGFRRGLTALRGQGRRPRGREGGRRHRGPCGPACGLAARQPGDRGPRGRVQFVLVTIHPNTSLSPTGCLSTAKVKAHNNAAHPS